MNEDEKCYRAVAWDGEAGSVGQRVTIYAKDLADAKRRLVAQFGDDKVITLSSEQDSDRPR